MVLIGLATTAAGLRLGLDLSLSGFLVRAV
jgi:hypothetical protein